MKKPFMLAAFLLFGATLVQGMIIAENSVACGSTVEKGKKNKHNDRRVALPGVRCPHRRDRLPHPADETLGKSLDSRQHSH